MPVKHHREGFTLIELLVVISIIALLIAILLPALSAARDSARAVQCLSNQRQIGISLITYSHEHNDYVPPVADNRIAWPARYWTSRLIDRRYIASPEVLFCPTWAPNSYEEADAEWPGRPWVVHTRGYGLRDWPVPNVAGSDAWKENRKLADIPQPSDFFAVADSILLDDQVQYYHISARPTDNFRKWCMPGMLMLRTRSFWMVAVGRLGKSISTHLKARRRNSEANSKCIRHRKALRRSDLKIYSSFCLGEGNARI